MPENTLRSALADAIEKHETEPAAPQDDGESRDVGNQPPPTSAPAVSAPEAAAEPAQPARADATVGRARDERGRLLPGKAVRPEPAPAAAPAAAAPAIEPPSSWKKEYWDAYKQLPPNVASYIKSREQQYIDGVTTYKQEAQSAREIRDALAPFEQDFRQAGVTPAQGIVRLAEAHRQIRAATPEGKLRIFADLAQQYGVPLHSIQSGQVDPIMQYVAPLQQSIEQLRLQQNSWQEQQRNAEQTAMLTEIESFAASNEHFEAVRPVMAGLLQSGLASDLKSAYEKALKMEGLAAPQPQTRADPAAVQRARAAAVSPKSATPAPGTVTTSGKKDVRSILEEQVEQFLGGARV